MRAAADAACSLSPLQRGEGWGEGPLSANAAVLVLLVAPPLTRRAVRDDLSLNLSFAMNAARDAAPRRSATSHQLQRRKMALSSRTISRIAENAVPDRAEENGPTSRQTAMPYGPTSLQLVRSNNQRDMLALWQRASAGRLFPEITDFAPPEREIRQLLLWGVEDDGATRRYRMQRQAERLTEMIAADFTGRTLDEVAPPLHQGVSACWDQPRVWVALIVRLFASSRSTSITLLCAASRCERPRFCCRSAAHSKTSHMRSSTFSRHCS